MAEGLTSPVIGTRMVGLPDEWVAGTMRTRGSPSVTIHVSVGIKREAGGALNAHGVTVAAQGAMATWDVACTVEGNLQDLVEVSVADIEIGAGVVDSERLREAYAAGCPD